MTRVAYQGAEGAFSEAAALTAYPDAETVGYATFHEVFEAVAGGAVHCGVVPVENSLAGSINQTYDLLLEHDLHVVGEVILRVQHCLVAPKGTRIEEVRRVISHPQALAQCDGFLARYHLEGVPVYDTAGAARQLAQHPEPGVAAIASRRAAERYGLEVLAEGIEDFEFNYTRFFVLATQERPRGEGPHKTSVVFALRQRLGHSPGGLLEVLQGFAEHRVNLTKLESRPRRDRPWSYVFYVDFEGHVEDPAPAQALLALLRRASFVKVLGSYPMAPNGA
ncbi:prephenate dehydratase [Marinithermus hydrothermalis]|uniref:prephenate dehydratase n=1 Tax=Marinithermus hydrothermalis TaxID=186192 RepID=UPI000300DF6F|nr:prephenate dehydratase [Marinithermus hydrothermalis]